MALSMAQLHLLPPDDQNEEQHDFFGHFMPLQPLLAPHVVHGIVNDTTACIGSGNKNEVQYNVFGHVIPLALVLSPNNTNGF